MCPKRHLYLGVYATEDLAALHYDRALVRLKGKSATTNFPIRNYAEEAEQNELMEKVRDLSSVSYVIHAVQIFSILQVHDSVVTNVCFLWMQYLAQSDCQAISMRLVLAWIKNGNLFQSSQR